MHLPRAVNLSCEFGGGGGGLAEQMDIKCAVVHGITSNLWYMIWKQLRGKKKVKIFGFIKTFCSIEDIYRYSLVH